MFFVWNIDYVCWCPYWCMLRCSITIEIQKHDKFYGMHSTYFYYFGFDSKIMWQGGIQNFVKRKRSGFFKICFAIFLIHWNSIPDNYLVINFCDFFQIFKTAFFRFYKFKILYVFNFFVQFEQFFNHIDKLLRTYKQINCCKKIMKKNLFHRNRKCFKYKMHWLVSELNNNDY